MAVSQQGKRRITIDEQIYLWRVFDEYEQGAFDGVQVTACSLDQTLFVRYGIQ